LPRATTHNVDVDGSIARPHEAFFLHGLGRLVIVPTNQVDNPALLPSTGVERQIPMPVQGASTPPEIQQRQETGRRGQEEFELCPAVQPRLMPYVASQLVRWRTAKPCMVCARDSK
jgi:hypothetical protein